MVRPQLHPLIRQLPKNSTTQRRKRINEYIKSLLNVIH
jgi:hypothetical protein